MKHLLSTLLLTLGVFYTQAQCTVTLNPSTIVVTQDSTIATNLGATQYYLVCEGVTLTYDGTQSADVTYYLEDAASVVSLTSHEAILYMKRLSSIDANYSQSGQWAITDNAWYDPSATFDDYIQGQNFNECTEVIFDYGTVSNCNNTTSITSLQKDFSISMYPNPARKDVSIQTNNSQEKLIIITNVLGKEVKQIKTDAKTIPVDISELKAGTYFVSIANKHGKKVTKKLIINK